MNVNNILETQIASGVTIVTDIIVLVAAIGYTIYAFLLMRQINLMNRSFSTPFKRLFTFVGRLHFFSSLILLFATFLNL